MARGDRREQVWVLAVVCFLIIGILLVVRWNSGRVVSEIPEKVKIGNKISGTIFMPYKKISSASQDTPAIVSLSKGEEMIKVETKTIGKIFETSARTKEGYYLQIKDILNYTFEQPGEYDFHLNIPGADLRYHERFSIE